MDTAPDPVTDAETETEAEAAALTDAGTAPKADECLACYLGRMLRSYGCVGDRFLRRWAKERRGVATGVRAWVRSRGGYCDCEVVMNALPPSRPDPILACARSVAGWQEDEPRR